MNVIRFTHTSVIETLFGVTRGFLEINSPEVMRGVWKFTSKRLRKVEILGAGLNCKMLGEVVTVQGARWLVFRHESVEIIRIQLLSNGVYFPFEINGVAHEYKLTRDNKSWVLKTSEFQYCHPMPRPNPSRGDSGFELTCDEKELHAYLCLALTIDILFRSRS